MGRCAQDLYCCSEVQLGCVQENKSGKVCTSHLCFHNVTICRYGSGIMPQDKVLCSIPGRALGNIQVICSFCVHVVAMGSCQPQQK